MTSDETALPELPGWTWGEPSIEPLTLTVSGDETAAVTVTNTAQGGDGTFEVSKRLSGIDPADLATDSFAADWTATLPDGSEADGTAAGPARTFPVGAMIELTERTPPHGALAPLYEWGIAVWSPGTSLLIEEDTGTAQLTVTNTAVPGTSLTVEKTLSGGTGAIPPDTRFPPGPEHPRARRARAGRMGWRRFR